MTIECSDHAGSAPFTHGVKANTAGSDVISPDRRFCFDRLLMTINGALEASERVMAWMPREKILASFILHSISNKQTHIPSKR